MSHLLDRVRRFAAQQSLWRADTRIVAAVSGGADSVALFCALQQLAAGGDCQLAGLAHLHHHIRGAEADGDAAFCRHLAERAGVPMVIGDAARPLRRIAWCTGGAQGMFEQAIALNVDAYLSGEISEQTVHLARESGVAYIAAGHHATERYGVQALGEHLAQRFGVQHRFIEIENPV